MGSTPTKTSTGSVAKRVLLGRAYSSNRLEHTLLPKVLALPVFASDALSSVAYATGEILIALTLVTSEPKGYLMPIAFAIAFLMAIVVSSYRQTVRAYPRGGGAYLVTKENLGTPAGLVADVQVTASMAASAAASPSVPGRISITVQVRASGG